MRRSSVLPQAKPRRRGNSLAPSMRNHLPGPPAKSRISRGAHKQLDELNIVCTKKEEDEAE